MESKEPKQKKPFYKKWWFIAIIVVLALGAYGSTLSEDEETGGAVAEDTRGAEQAEAAASDPEETEEPELTEEPTPEPTAEPTPEEPTPSPTPEPTEAPEGLTIGDTFAFDNLELTFGSEIVWGVVDNEFSEDNGKEVFGVPLTVKNLKDETHGLNFMYWTAYNSAGNKTENKNSYFDDGFPIFEKMRTDASLTKNVYLLYDGDGDYYVEFKTLLGDATEVKIPIKKP